jgi:hypothetical protein
VLFRGVAADHVGVTSSRQADPFLALSIFIRLDKHTNSLPSEVFQEPVLALSNQTCARFVEPVLALSNQTCARFVFDCFMLWLFVALATCAFVV